MQGRICAYCGMGLPTGWMLNTFARRALSRMMRLKQGYWKLAYECSNLLLGCTVCNRIRKEGKLFLSFRAQPDVRTPRGTPWRWKSASCWIRRKTLLEDGSATDLDDSTGRLIPNPGLDAGALITRARNYRLLLGLESRRGGAILERSKAYEQAARAAADQRWDDASAQRYATSPAHSLAARIVLQSGGAGAAARRRRRDEGLQIDSLWSDLRTLVSEIGELGGRRAMAPRPWVERQLQALGWALAATKADPPASDPATADAYLGEPQTRDG